jgi:hypothetical protein
MHTKPFELYSLADPAVDVEGTPGKARRRYLQFRDNPQELKIVAGRKPTVFVCSDIQASIFNRYVMGGETEVERNTRAFQVGVTGVRNLVSRVDGEARPDPRPSGEIGDGKMWSDEEMDMFAPVYQQDVGSVLLMRSALPFGSSVTFQPQPLLLSVYLARCSQSAERTPDTAPPPSAKDKGTPTSQPAADGGEGTGATATVSPTNG